MPSHTAALVTSSPAQPAGIGPRRLGTALIAASAVAYAAAVVWVTLRPVPWATEGAEESLGILSPAAWFDLAAWVEGRPLEMAFNVAMFVPIGAAVSLLLRTRWAITIPLVFTLGIELAQIPLDRISHPRDLALNAFGALLGVAAVAVARRGWPGRARRLHAPVVALAGDPTHDAPAR